MRISLALTVALLLTPGVWAREWKDSSGKFSVEAEFQGIENNRVILEKEDGKVVNIPLHRLSRKDREYVTEAIGVQNRVKLGQEIKQVFKQGQTETEAKSILLEGEAAEKLHQRFSGQLLTLRFPIINVQPGSQGSYVLALNASGFFAGMRYGCIQQYSRPLSRAEVLAINQQSTLIVSGKINLNYYDIRKPRDEFGLGKRFLTFTSRQTQNRLEVYLDNVKYRIVNSREEEDAIRDVKIAKVKKQDRQESSGRMAFNSPVGVIELGGVPKIVAGDGQPADPKMYYTSEVLADGAFLVTIHNTPLGNVRAAVSSDSGEIGGVRGFRVGGKADNPFVSIKYSNGKVTSVKWDGRKVRLGKVEK